MDHVAYLLNHIEDGLIAHGGELGGATLLAADTLSVFDARVVLRATVECTPQGSVHAHVLATLTGHADEVLDACLMGQGDVEHALQEVAGLWITGVAGPIRSFLDGRAVCMTCRSGVTNADLSAGEVQDDYGFSDRQAYVGPSFARGFDEDMAAIDDSRPWFQYADAAAAPRRVHLAKSMVMFTPDEGWTRHLEVDGHDVSFREQDWPAGVTPAQFGYLIRYAVFEFPPDSQVVAERAQLEQAIRYFATHYASSADVDTLMADMARAGFDLDLISEIEGISTIAFARYYFEPHGAEFSPFIFRARRDGRVESRVPLMSIPAFTRAKALAPTLDDELSEPDFQALCLYSAEAQAILQVMESTSSLALETVTFHPCVVPERGVSDATFKRALEALDRATARVSADSGPTATSAKARKPWWKFWG